MDAVVLAPPELACVVAADESRGIGRGDDLPWPRLRGDVAHFRRITSETRDPARQNAVIMGRRTWDTIPARYRPLSGRINIVVSRTQQALDGAAAVTDGLGAAIDAAVAAGAESIYVVGGGQIYTAALADRRCQLIYYTQVGGRFDADTFFPPFEDRFVLEAEDPPREDAGVGYVIQRWRRRPG